MPCKNAGIEAQAWYKLEAREKAVFRVFNFVGYTPATKRKNSWYNAPEKLDG